MGIFQAKEELKKEYDIALIGDPKTGKSTFINLLAVSDLLS